MFIACLYSTCFFATVDFSVNFCFESTTYSDPTFYSKKVEPTFSLRKIENISYISYCINLFSVQALLRIDGLHLHSGSVRTSNHKLEQKLTTNQRRPKNQKVS